jgi:SpoVK/Ycf46/Vps4 family AAA+-type ATPase
MENTDTALINMYSDAYRKRLKKMNADSTAFSEQFKAPEADFAGRNEIAYEQNTKILPLNLVATDSNHHLDHFNILVNETPVFGANGIDLRSRDTGKLDTTINVTLSNGENRLEVLVTNSRGMENYRYPLYVRYVSSSPAKEKVYFAGIGINRFADTSHNLKYCEKDIRDLALKLKEKYGADIQIDTLFNENVTLEKVRAIKEKLMQSQEDDKVIIAYSGHGLLSKNYDYYLSTYSVNFNQPEQNGLAYGDMENLVDGIKARKKLMLIDACHSGELDKEEMQKIAALQAELKDSGVVTGAKGIDHGHAGKLGAKNSFELMQELFVNIGRGTGTTIISAAAGTQFALERGDLRNGVFTYSILELLKGDGPVTVNQLKKHVSKRVSELTKGLQQPTTRNEIQSVDWTVW